MKPAEIATILKIAPTTVRTWSTQFAAYMSPEAVGGNGRFRDFSDDDLRVLYFIQQRKRDGADNDQLHAQLKIEEAAGFARLADVPDSPSTAIVPMVPAGAIDVERRALAREIAVLQDDRQRLEQRLADEQAGRRADVDKYLRELRDVSDELSATKTLLKLYEEGRLKPPTNE